ncbi:condensation domain-containing protein [Kitasatospora sp. NPDC054939]
MTTTARPSSDQLEIALSTGRAGAGPATWGQQAIWDAVSALGPVDAPRYNITTATPLGAGLPVPALLDGLRGLLELHDGLRTRLRPVGADGLEQVVDAAGRLPVTVVRCGDDPAEVAEAGRRLHEELAGLPFDCTEEWPIRVGFVEAGGSARHFSLVLSHTAVDGFGMRRLVGNLTALVQGGSPAGLARSQPCLQPLEEAAFQVSERGRRRDSRARQHWVRKLRGGPARIFPEPAADAQELKFPNAVLRSPALARALPLVAAGFRVSPQSVLLAAAAAMTARISGRPEAVFQVVVNNRFVPGLAHAVSVVAGDGVFHLDDIGGDFADVLRRAQSASLATYRHAYFNRRLLDGELAQLAADGQADGLADRSCVFNDTLDLVPGQPAEDVPADEPLERTLARSVLAPPVEFEPRRGLSFALDALRAPGAVELAMTADGTVLPRADIERFLFGMEELVVAAAGRAG